MRSPFIDLSSIQVEPNLELVALSEREENTVRSKVLRFFSHLVNYVHLSISIFPLALSLSLYQIVCDQWDVWESGFQALHAPTSSYKVPRQLSSRRSDPPVLCLKLARKAGIEKPLFPNGCRGGNGFYRI